MYAVKEIQLILLSCEHDAELKFIEGIVRYQSRWEAWTKKEAYRLDKALHLARQLLNEKKPPRF